MPEPGQLVRYGWTEAVSHSYTTYSGTPARVVRVDRGSCDVVTPSDFRKVRATGVCTGDWVTVSDTDVVDVLPRRGTIARAAVSGRSETQVLAANVDLVGIVCPLEGDSARQLRTQVDLARIERLLALGWESGAQPVVILTKADTADDPDAVVAEVEAVAPGAQVLAVSAATGTGVDTLTELIRGTIVLLGASGAGKSTLANALAGSAAMSTGAVRDVDGKGRHTTVHRELIPLPSGGALIDTPGLRGVGIMDAEDGIELAFRDVEELAQQCRFDDCAHVAEPGCAVLAAIADGRIPQRRLASYHKLMRENAWAAARSDARLAAERTRTHKAQSRALRNMYKVKGRK